MQRNYVINRGNFEIRIDFGKENSKDYTTMVRSEIRNGKVKVVEATTLGKAYKWDKDRINSYLMELYGIEDKE